MGGYEEETLGDAREGRGIEGREGNGVDEDGEESELEGWRKMKINGNKWDGEECKGRRDSCW